MRNRSSIEFHIPVPWHSLPVRIRAHGTEAVLAATFVTCLLLLLLIA